MSNRQKDETSHSSIPLIVVVVFGDVCRAHSTRSHGMFILIHHLASEQNICVQQTCFELLQCERIGLVTNAFKANNSIAADTVDEGENAGQDLDFELYDEERGVLDVDAEEAGIEVFGCQCLEEESVWGMVRVESSRDTQQASGP
jgi:hypothetical protein